MQSSVKVIVEDYPYLSNPFFSYALAGEFAEKIMFGSLVQVPLGTSNTLRFGVVIALEPSSRKNLKAIHSVISTQSPLSPEIFNFLIYLSSSYFYPLSLLFQNAGILPLKKNLRYRIEFSPQLIEEIRNDDLDLQITKYLESHQDGFFEDLLLKKFHWKKTNKIYRKIEHSVYSKKIIQVSYPKQHQKTSLEKQGMFLLNGLDPNQRIAWLEEYVKKYSLKKVLMIVPSQLQAKKMRILLSSLAPLCQISCETKQALLKFNQQYDLIFIDDSTSSSYSWNKPFGFSIVKTAFYRSMQTKEAIVISSFLPHVFSYYQINSGYFSHLALPEYKPKKTIFPKIAILSMNREIQQHGYSTIPYTALRHIEHYLDQRKKIFILINRKGFYNFLICKHCGHVLKCSNCQIVLSSSPDQQYVYCRYCHQRLQIPSKCPECEKPSIRFFAPGTQKIEHILETRFHGKKILRLDKDTLSPILQNQISLGQFDIITGTVLALDHLEFDQIDFCLWLGLDTMMNYPSFSAEEEAWYLLSRLYEKMASETDKKMIMLSTYSPNSELLNAVRNRKTGQFYRQHLHTRKILSYPPFADWMEMHLSSNDEVHLQEQLNVLQSLFKKNPLIQINSIKKIPPGLSEGKKGYSLLFKSSNAMELYPILSSIIDEYKKNEKIFCNIKVLE